MDSDKIEDIKELNSEYQIQLICVTVFFLHILFME